MMTTLARSATTLAVMFMVGSSSIFAQSQSNTPNEVMSAYYGNTLTCRTTALQCHIWFNNDGTYRQFETVPAADGSFRVTGFDGQYKVSLKDGAYETCLTGRVRGGPAGRRPVVDCYKFGGHKPGDAWDAKTNDGTAIHFSLQSGRHVNAGSSFL